MQCKLNPDQSLKDIPKKQKQAPIKPLSYFTERYKTRDECMAQAYLSGHYTLEQVGVIFWHELRYCEPSCEAVGKDGMKMSNVRPDPLPPSLCWVLFIY